MEHMNIGNQRLLEDIFLCVCEDFYLMNLVSGSVIK